MIKTIDTYTNDIYETHLIVATKDVTLEELKELYTYSDNIELDDDLMGPSASSSTVKSKVDNTYAVLVKFNNFPKYCKTAKQKAYYIINTAAHEAAHYCLDVFDWIGCKANRETTEPFAYLLGWATECIYKTWTKTK